MDDQPFDDQQFGFAPLPPPNYETYMCYYPARPLRLRERFEAFLATIPDPEERDVEEMVRRLLVIVDHDRDELPPEEIPPPPDRPPPQEIRPPWVAPPTFWRPPSTSSEDRPGAPTCLGHQVILLEL